MFHMWKNIMKLLLTAGNAKKDMPKMAQHAAINFPAQVIGTVSP